MGMTVVCGNLLPFHCTKRQKNRERLNYILCTVPYTNILNLNWCGTEIRLMRGQVAKTDLEYERKEQN